VLSNPFQRFLFPGHRYRIDRLHYPRWGGKSRRERGIALGFILKQLA
jgi:hypothetical protein